MVLLVLLVILLLSCLSQLWLSGFLMAIRMMVGFWQCWGVLSFLLFHPDISVLHSLLIVPLPFISTPASASHDSCFQSGAFNGKKELSWEKCHLIYLCLLFWFCLYPDQDNAQWCYLDNFSLSYWWLYLQPSEWLNSFYQLPTFPIYLIIFHNWFLIPSHLPSLQSVCITPVCGTGTEGAGSGQSCCCLKAKESLPLCV